VSVPTNTLECESCGYTGGTGVVFGAFRYVVADREYAINRTLGWCSACDGFVPIEQFSDEIVALTRLENSIAEVSRYFSRTVMLCLTKSARFRRDSLFDDLSDTAFRLRLGKDRRGTEKCLRCGSQKVVPVNCSLFPEDYYEENDTKTAIGFTHPGCGGQILASTCPYRFNRVFEPEYFSINGYRLAGELNE
jgi:hypothetical protein